MTNTVKCAECGWLGLRLIGTGEIIEASEAFRESGYLPAIGGPSSLERACQRTPLCFANKRPFYTELKTPDAPEDKGKAALGQDIECDAFIEWQPGLAPKDLQKMKLLEEQRRWQEERLTADRVWQASESAKAEKRHKDSLDASSKQHSQQLVVVGVVGTVVLALATIVGAFIQRGYWLTPPEVNPPTIINNIQLPPATPAISPSATVPATPADPSPDKSALPTN